eukprot:6623205-Pyramimonas_sp.AAC.3
MRLFGRDGVVDGSSRVTDGLVLDARLLGDQVQTGPRIRKNTASDGTYAKTLDPRVYTMEHAYLGSALKEGKRNIRRCIRTMEGGMGGLEPNASGTAATVAQLHLHLDGERKDVNWFRRWGLAIVVWALFCVRTLLATVPVLERKRYELIFLYYQPLLLMVSTGMPLQSAVYCLT